MGRVQCPQSGWEDIGHQNHQCPNPADSNSNISVESGPFSLPADCQCPGSLDYDNGGLTDVCAASFSQSIYGSFAFRDLYVWLPMSLSCLKTVVLSSLCSSSEWGKVWFGLTPTYLLRLSPFHWCWHIVYSNQTKCPTLPQTSSLLLLLLVLLRLLFPSSSPGSSFCLRDIAQRLLLLGSLHQTLWVDINIPSFESLLTCL